MIIDANGFLGRWGLRSRGISGPEDFLRCMDSNGIGRSVVTSTVALVTDTRAGNRHLIECTGRFRDRLVPLACINPRWGVGEALAWLDAGFKGLRLYPALHHYSLKDYGILDPVMDRLRDEAGFIYVTAGISQHFSDMARSIGFKPGFDFDALCAFARRYDFLKVVVTGYSPEFYEIEKLADITRKHAKIYFDTSNWVQASLIERAVVNECIENIVFGSASGILELSASVAKVGMSDADDEAKKKVFADNAARVFGDDII